MTSIQRRSRWVPLAALLVAAPPVPAQDADPEAIEQKAREDLAQTDGVRMALNAWLSASGAAIGAKDWSAVVSNAERAWMLALEAQEHQGHVDYPVLAAKSKMYMARAAYAKGNRHAAAMYREAGEINPSGPPFYSAGMVAKKHEDYEAARRDFLRALEFDDVPKYAYYGLAQVLYAMGDTEGAIARVKEGIEAGAKPATGKRLLKKYEQESEVEADYSTGGNRRFAIAFQDVDEQAYFRRETEAGLDAAYDSVGRFLGKYPDSTVQVVIYPSRGEYFGANNVPQWAGASYNGKLRIPYRELKSSRDTESFRRTLAHEYAHYLVERLGGRNVPSWMNEGLAQHAERGSELEPYMQQYMKRALKKYRRQPFPFSMSSKAGRIHGAARGGVYVSYAAAFYAVDALLKEKGMYRVTSFLDALKGGMSVEDAMYREFYLTYPKLDELWQTHAKSELGVR